MRPLPPPSAKAFLTFLIPMMGANILQALSGTVNNIYVGQMLGVSALAAVSAFFPLMFFCISFIIGLGGGASVLIGQAFGAGEADKVKEVAGTTLAVTIIGGVLFAFVGIMFTTPILVAIGTPPDILADAADYARVMLLVLPGFFVFLLMTSMMRGVGDSKTPLYGLLIATAIGLILTPALIQGWGGLPRMGIRSPAWATIIGAAASLTWLAVHLLRRRHPLAPDWKLMRHLWIDWRILKTVLKIAIPTGVQMVIISLAEIAVLSFVNRFGSDATAAYGAVNQVVSFVQFPAISIAITGSIFAAQAIGASRIDRLGTILGIAIRLNFAVTGGLVLLGYVFSRPLLGMFITSPPVIELAQGLLHITLWSYVLFGMAAVLSSLMRASGTVLVPTAISILCVFAIEVPAAFLLSQWIGIDGVWIAYPIAFAAMLVLQAGYYRLVWQKKTITRLI